MFVCGECATAIVVVQFSLVSVWRIGFNQSRKNTNNCTFQLRQIIQTNPDKNNNFHECFTTKQTNSDQLTTKKPKSFKQFLTGSNWQYVDRKWNRALSKSKYVIQYLPFCSCYTLLWFAFVSSKRMHSMRSAIYRQSGKWIQLDSELGLARGKTSFQHARPKHLVHWFYYLHSQSIRMNACGASAVTPRITSLIRLGKHSPAKSVFVFIPRNWVFF